jgi:ATP-dependent Zn protease
MVGAADTPGLVGALEKIVLGPARPLVMSEDEPRRVAYHEGGHTILGLLVAGADPVNRVDAEIQRILEQAHDSGVQLLQQHRQALDALALALVETETLDEDEILRVTGLKPSPRLESLPRPIPAAANGKR